MFSRFIGVFILLYAAIALADTAELSLTKDFWAKTTLKQNKIEFDTSLVLSLSADKSDLDFTWKGDENGFSSFKVVWETELPKDIDGRAEVLFDEEKVKSIKLKEYDFPLSEAYLDLETYFKHKDDPYLYQVSLDLDEFTLARLPASLDLVYREEYLRAKLTLDREVDSISLQGIWKKGTLYEGKATLDHNGEDWSVKEVLIFKPTLSLLYPEKGTLPVDGDIIDDLSLKVACYHTFLERGIEVTKLVSTIKLEMGDFDLTWKGTFSPVETVFSLGDYDLTLAAEAKLNDLTVNTVLKLDEDGFASFSVKLSL